MGEAVSANLFLAFVVFAAVASFTPGPNNVMLMGTGLNFGFRRAQPHVFGVALGFALMVALVGWGLGAIFTAYPVLYTILKYAGAAYLLYLAWHLARAGTIDPAEGNGRPMTFLQAAAFQWINAKAWVMAIAAITTYAAFAAFPLNVILISLVFLGIAVVSSWCWVLFGSALRRFMTNPGAVRAFNIAMAVALVASLYPVFAEH